MKYILPILLLFIGCSESNNELDKVLNFPSWSDTVSYSGCEDILSITPSKRELIVFSDTIIDFKEIDSRVPLKLNFNWAFDGWNFMDDTGHNSIGVESFEVIKENHIIDKFDLTDIIDIEANYYIKENGNIEDKPNKVISLIDLNLDSYLDIRMKQWCGRGCDYVHWIYNPNKKTFGRTHNKLSWISPIQYSCVDNKTILYSYADGMQWYATYHAYIMREDSLEFYQSQTINTETNLIVYKNAIGDTINVESVDVQ